MMVLLGKTLILIGIMAAVLPDSVTHGSVIRMKSDGRYNSRSAAPDMKSDTFVSQTAHRIRHGHKHHPHHPKDLVGSPSVKMFNTKPFSVTSSRWNSDGRNANTRQGRFSLSDFRSWFKPTPKPTVNSAPLVEVESNHHQNYRQVSVRGRDHLGYEVPHHKLRSFPSPPPVTHDTDRVRGPHHHSSHLPPFGTTDTSFRPIYPQKIPHHPSTPSPFHSQTHHFKPPAHISPGQGTSNEGSEDWLHLDSAHFQDSVRDKIKQWSQQLLSGDESGGALSPGGPASTEDQPAPSKFRPILAPHKHKDVSSYAYLDDIDASEFQGFGSVVDHPAHQSTSEKPKPQQMSKYFEGEILSGNHGPLRGTLLPVQSPSDDSPKQDKHTHSHAVNPNIKVEHKHFIHVIEPESYPIRVNGGSHPLYPITFFKEAALPNGLRLRTYLYRTEGPIDAHPPPVSKILGLTSEDLDDVKGSQLPYDAVEINKIVRSILNDPSYIDSRTKESESFVPEHSFEQKKFPKSAMHSEEPPVNTFKPAHNPSEGKAFTDSDHVSFREATSSKPKKKVIHISKKGNRGSYNINIREGHQYLPRHSR